MAGGGDCNLPTEAVFGDSFAESLPLEQFGDCVGDALMAAVVKDGRTLGVVDLCDSLGIAIKPRQPVPVLHHFPVDSLVVSAADEPQSTFAEFRRNRVAAERLSDSDRHG